MNTALILIASGILIGAGIAIIWRDIQKKRRGGFVSQREAPLEVDPELEITISHGTEADGSPASGRAAAVIARPAAVAAARAAQGGLVMVEQQWSGMQAAIASGVEDTNTALAQARLFIATPGEPSWSYKNKGYGAYRRLLLAGESLGWLRLELSNEGQLRANFKAHKDDRAAINASADIGADGLTATRAGDLLLRCLEPAASYAARLMRNSEEVESEQAWEIVEPLVASALTATNGALAQTGARLVALAPARYDDSLRRHRMTLSVEVNGDDVARMHIERLLHEMEVAVGVREAHLIELGRRRRIPVEGMSIHGLAELIASCAWPAIARFREQRREA